jgi:subtilisin family serine protease
VRVLDRNSNSWESWLLAGLEWVTDTRRHPPFEVANMSLGGPNSRALNDAIARSTANGITYVVAAGNDSKDCEDTSPANSVTQSVITVSALADSNGQPGGGSPFDRLPVGDDTFATFSNYGAGEDGVDLMAPGVAILSTWLHGGYHRLGGTSMAAPHVSGAAALYIARHGGTPSDVKAALLAAAQAPDSSEGYSGGTRDGVNEPLLYVATF